MQQPGSLRRQLRTAYLAVSMITGVCALAALATAFVSHRAINQATAHEIPQLQRTQALSHLVDNAISHVFFQLSAQDRTAFDEVSSSWHDIAQPMSELVDELDSGQNVDLITAIRAGLADLQRTRNAINFAINEKLDLKQAQQVAVRQLGAVRADTLEVIDTLAEITYTSEHSHDQHKQLDALKRAIDSYAPTLLALPSESRKLQIRLAQVRTRSFVIDATANLHGLPDKPVAFFKRGIRAIQELGDGDTAIPALRLAELDASARASALRNDAKAITDRVQEHLAVLTERANSQLNDHVASSDNIKWQLVYLVCALAVVSLGSVVWFQVRFLDDRLMRPLNTLTDQIESFKQHGTIQPLPALPTNEIQQVAETFHAVAKQKRAHEARLDEQNDDLNRLNARLAETNREQSEFSYAVSHDLKSPINTLRMLLGELQHVDQAVEPETHERFLAQAVSTLSRMTRLIDSVLQYASMVENRHAQERVNLDQVLGEVLTDLEADIRDAGASIDCDRLGNLNGSPFQLRMLLQNLIGNAIKFRRAGTAPVITVHRVASSPNHLNLEIADNGIGIPVEHQEKVFSLFHRLHNTSDYAGSGLGLALCKRIVSNHNGRIQIGSVTPHGTVFHIALPTQLPVWQAA